MKLLVTSALPYANGDVHLGHLAGAYLPADIFVKYHRLRKSDVVYVCGSDEHGVPITIAAQQLGCSPRELIDRYHFSIRDSFERFGIEFDNYSRTSLPLHYQTAQAFFLRVHERGFLQPQKTRQLYCPNDRMFLADRYVEGICPNCGSAGARGDQCEACGRWIDPLELIDPRCRTCNARPEIRETTHWFFALSRLQDELRRWLDTKRDWKPNVRRFCEGWFAKGLRDRSVTRDLTWGVPVPLPEAAGKVMYVWFDAPIGYISATKEWAERSGRPELWRDYWLDPTTRLVHFIGKDNIVFHAIVWPAMLMAHGDFVLPTDVPANEFLNLEGEKISTSRNRAVWLPEYLKDFPADILRYALAVNLPENRDVDFTWHDFQARNNNELADVLGNFVNRVAVFVQKNYGGRCPNRNADDSAAGEVMNAIATAPARIGELIDSYRIKDAAREMMTLPALGNRYFDHQSPWRTIKTDRVACDRTIATCLRLVSTLEIVCHPFLPFTSRKIGRMLGLGERSWSDAVSPSLPSELGPVEILFNKIGDEAIAVQIQRLSGRAGGTGVTDRPAEEKMITIDDFSKVQMKAAKILTCERVPGADKLLKMTVDIGSEQRQLVAGVGKAYEPAALVGRTIIVVVNLVPAKIRGVESNAMLLAATGPDGMSLLTLDRELAPGASVS